MRLRGRLSGLTLRTQLTVLLFAMVLLACAAVGVVTNIVIHNFLNSRLDHELALAGSRYAVSLEHNDGDADNHPETATVGQSVGTLGARLSNGQLTAVGVVSDAPAPIVVSAADRARIIDVAGSGINRATVQFAGLGSYRVQVATGSDGDMLVTGLPERSVEDLLEVLRWTESSSSWWWRWSSVWSAASRSAAPCTRWNGSPRPRCGCPTCRSPPDRSG